LREANFLKKDHLQARLVLALLTICVIGCDVSDSRSNAAAKAIGPLFVEYKIQGGFAGGTRYLFLITTSETNTGMVTNAAKQETYVVPEGAAKEAMAILQKHDFFSWKAAQPSKYAAVFKMTLTATTSSTTKEFVLFDVPDGDGQAKKKLTNLVEELQNFAKRQGHLLKSGDSPKDK